MYKNTLILIISILSFINTTFAQENNSLGDAIIKKVEAMPDSLLSDSVMETEVHMPMDSVKFEALMNQGTSATRKKKKKVSLAIKVVDKKSGEPIEAIVNMKASTQNETAFEGVGMCNEKGIFQLKLSPNSDIELTISFPEYLPIHKTFKFTNKDQIKFKVHKKYKLTKLVVGEYIQLKRIYFQEGEFELLSLSYEQLNTLVTLMNNHPKMKIEIAGHTDNSGSAKYNQRLSQNRADAVKRYLVDKGVKKKRIKGVGYGGTKPIVNGKDPKSKQENRRVEFKVIKL